LHPSSAFSTLPNPTTHNEIGIRAAGQFHGYPVLPEESIGHLVYNRFTKWADAHGTPADRAAATACRLRYNFR